MATLRNDPCRAPRGSDGRPLPRVRRAGVLAMLAAFALAACDEMAPPPPDGFWDAEDDATAVAVETSASPATVDGDRTATPDSEAQPVAQPPQGDLVVAEASGPYASAPAVATVTAVVAAAPRATPEPAVGDESLGAAAPERAEPQRTVVAAQPAEPPQLRVYQMGPVRGPRLNTSATSHDWGVAIIGKPIQHTFRLRNSGDRPLQIRRASPTLGCASVKFQREIAAGETGTFEVTIDTARMLPGRSRLTIVLETSDRRSDATLMLQGRVEDARGAMGPARDSDRATDRGGASLAAGR